MAVSLMHKEPLITKDRITKDSPSYFIWSASLTVNYKASYGTKHETKFTINTQLGQRYAS